MKKAIDIARRAYEKPDGVSGITTGLRDLDQQIGGLHQSDLVILAARPGMGKTALATHIAAAAAAQGPVLFFSLEMGGEQLAQRVLSEQSGIDGHALRTGKLSNDDFGRLVAALTGTTSLKLVVDDTPSLTVPAIRTRARRVSRKQGLSLIVIDYVQLIECPSKDGNRVQELTKITRGLKAIAKELNVPVIALSQLNRGVENREDRRPRLADLRDSGSIEQDADVVMFLYREEYYARQDCDPSIKGVAEIDIAKQRHGPIGTVNVFFDPAHTAFADLARER
jgi:replicative DNA helicase